MYPILVPLVGGLAIHSYGVLVAAALLVGIAVTRRGAVARGISAHQSDEIVVATIIGGLIGARLYYVLFADPAMFWQRPWEVAAVWRGGLAVHGGWLAGAGTMIVALRRRGVPAWRFADSLAPALALGQAIGRIGCFLSGCCFGLPTALPWGVTFRHPESLAPLGMPLHPTQLYESAWDLAVFGLLWCRCRGGRLSFAASQLRSSGEERPRCDGRIILLYFMLSSAGRFAVEALRWDSLYLWGTTLKMAQLVSAVLFITAGVLWVSRKPTGRVQSCMGHKTQDTRHK